MTRAAELAAALGYASRGWAVFPLRPGSKKPAVPGHTSDRCDHTDPACRAGHAGWEQRATTCPDQIRTWWSRSSFGVGIAAGPSGLVVVDLDTPNEGDTDQRTGAAVLDALAASSGGCLPLTHTVATPSGGWHLYFTAPATGSALGNTTGRLGAHIDTRAAGGYVVAPPTRTPAGRYLLPRDTDPVPLPGWLHQRLAAPRVRPSRQQPPITQPRPTTLAASSQGGRLDRYVTGAVMAECRRVERAQPGVRNHTLFTAAVALGQLVGAGVCDEHHATGVLEAATAGHIDAGAFDETQARATIASGLRRGITEPRRIPAHLTSQLGGVA